MNADPEYRPFQFTIADLLAVMVIVAVLGATSRLPASFFQVFPMLAVLYVVKYRILTLRVQPWLGSLLYFLVVLALLPYLYCRLMDTWNSGFVSSLANWIGLPVLVFAVPTVFFLYDTLAQRRPSLKDYAIRSLAEIVFLFPLWAFVWVRFLMWLVDSIRI